MSKSEARHTPGLWHVGIGQHDGKTPFITVFSGDKIVAVTGIANDDHHGQSMIDARLLAAAPELLEALEECIEHMTNSNDCTHGNGFTYDFCPVEKARAVIANARGER